ncbi:hypothetical protein [Enterococcus cecorum]|uniref:AbrB/MazE/SpoVT family DNA-binding domain-containing protein n=1 Tax=Enterococcus cecorum TaxID=44008 RepID=UPI0006439405|nr:hypothetical protein [Enterococcus cecorum]KLO69862.1 Programmed cell death antitoxin MazE [Enterococcus cecorum]CAI3455434.1 antitoxin MazE [Enterococcus cecorum]
MKITTRKIGNSVGTIFPKEIAPKVEEEYSVYKVEDTYILKPKQEDIFANKDQWTGFSADLSDESLDRDTMKSEENEF